MPTLAAGPDYYKRAHFRSPTEYTDTPFQRAFNTDLGFYEYLSQHPDAANNFHTYLSALQKRSPQWVDWFPVQERLIDGFKPDQQGKNVLLIDIGGGEGHYIKTFLKKFPHAPGRLVLQDIHQPKDTEELRMGFESMKHNFFDSQPIRGKLARLSYESRDLGTHLLACLTYSLSYR